MKLEAAGPCWAPRGPVPTVQASHPPIAPRQRDVILKRAPEERSGVADDRRMSLATLDLGHGRT
jgi:hypothetical protein